ncbi:MAG TPA: hypothetical protein PK954_02565, partial [Anaerolineales bacterium]|nr:hypothetical protein [Anaerolineales bacterium]
QQLRIGMRRQLAALLAQVRGAEVPTNQVAQVVDLLCDGDDEGFYNALQRTRNSTNICGLSPTYLAMKVMGAVEGERVAYDVCPADGAETSVVTIAGLVFESI